MVSIEEGHVIKHVLERVNELHLSIYKELPLHVVNVITYKKRKKDVEQTLEKLEGCLKTFPLTTLQQLYRGGMRNLVRSILIQTLCSYGYLSLNFGFSHGDLELRNVLIKRIDIEKHPEYARLIYIVGHVAYIVLTHGIIFVLCDFDTSIVGKGIAQRTETVHNDVLRFVHVLGKETNIVELCNLSNQCSNMRPSRCAPLWLLRECPFSKPIEVTPTRLSRWLEWQAAGVCTLLFIHNDIQTRSRRLSTDIRTSRE